MRGSGCAPASSSSVTSLSSLPSASCARLATSSGSFLRLRFSSREPLDVVALGGEADAERRVRRARRRSRGCRPSACSVDRQRRRPIFLIFCSLTARRACSRRPRRRAMKTSQRVDAREHGVGHLRGAVDVDARHAGRRRQRRRARDERHLRARLGGRLREREAHLAGARVGDAAHGIDRLERRARRSAARACRRAPSAARDATSAAKISSRLQHAALAVLVARELAGVGAEDRDAVGARAARRCAGSPRSPTSAGSSRARPAAGIRARGTASTAGRRRGRARAWRGNRRRRARRRWRRRRARSRCGPSRCRRRMSHRSVSTGRPDSAWNVVGVTKRVAAVGHHDVDGDAGLHEQARELGGLVRGDAAGHAEHDAGERGRGAGSAMSRYREGRAPQFTLFAMDARSDAGTPGPSVERMRDSPRQAGRRAPARAPAARGPAALTDAELVAVMLAPGSPGATALDVARRLIAHCGGLAGLARGVAGRARVDPRHRGTGTGRAGSRRWIEFARRVRSPTLPRGDALTSPDAVRDYLGCVLAPGGTRCSSGSSSTARTG